MCVCTSEPITLFTGRQQSSTSGWGNPLLEMGHSKADKQGEEKEAGEADRKLTAKYQHHALYLIGQVVQDMA